MLYSLMAMALATTFPAAAPNSIDVQIGGLLSGPTRRYVDLARGLLLAGDPAAGGPHGDGAGVATADLRVSFIVALTRQETEGMRDLAGKVLAHGPEAAQPCAPTVDRIIRLEVRLQGRAVSGVVYCPSPDTQALVDAVFRAARRKAGEGPPHGG